MEKIDDGVNEHIYFMSNSKRSVYPIGFSVFVLYTFMFIGQNFLLSPVYKQSKLLWFILLIGIAIKSDIEACQIKSIEMFQ